MIYGVSGGSGTGKSTLCQKVAGALSIPFVPTSITQMAREAGFNAVGKLTLLERVTLQESLLTQFETLLNGLTGPVILDRTPVDLIGYLGAEVNMHSHDEVNLDTLKRIESYYARCQALTARRFDRVFVTSVLPNYDLAETRPSFNPAYQRHVHMLIIGAILTTKESMEVSILVTEDLNERVDIVSNAILSRVNEIAKLRQKSRHIH